MANLGNWLPALGVLFAIFLLVEVSLAYRAAQMRALAKRYGWSYSAGSNHIWKLIVRNRESPSNFWFGGLRMDALWATMNIVEGQHNGMRVLVLDSLWHFGIKHDRYVTFIGIKTNIASFPERTGREKVAQAHGWSVLYRIRLSLITWSLSVKRIEEHLFALGAIQLASPHYS